MLRDMGLPDVSCTDNRRLEILATGLPLHGGVPLAVDATMVSALHGDGAPWPKADTEAGMAIERAHRRKWDTYPEIEAAPEMHLATLACEVGGRWSKECQDVIEQLARVRAREAPAYLRTATKLACAARWWAILSCAQQNALAATLIDDAVCLLDGWDTPIPDIVDILSECIRA